MNIDTFLSFNDCSVQISAFHSSEKNTNKRMYDFVDESVRYPLKHEKSRTQEGVFEARLRSVGTRRRRGRISAWASYAAPLRPLEPLAFIASSLDGVGSST